jgi:2-amino-4-hydroxy-6-hydroxymethyldihydropteridine diphosphokinase
VVRAFLGMGSNLGDRRATLSRAVGAIPEVVAVSPLYQTDPVGGPNQDPFLNLVVQLDTRRSPHQLLELCRELERHAGRHRRERWGPRTLDVDVLWIDGTTVDDGELTVPHPRMHERNFVMIPLLDLAPDLDVPGWDPERAQGAVRRLGPL